MKCDQWTSQSSEFFLYIAIVLDSENALRSFLDVTVEICIQCCDVSRDPEMRQQ